MSNDDLPSPEVSNARESIGAERDQADRAEKTNKILVEADLRDEEATARHVASERREHAADLKAFLDSGGPYPGHGERRAAAEDRTHAKDDRESSAEDRVQLAEVAQEREAGTSS